MADPGFELTFVWTQSLYCFNYVVYVIYVYDRTLKTIEDFCNVSQNYIPSNWHFWSKDFG